MNIKKILLTSAVALGALYGSAQQAAPVVEQYVFKPYWYGQLQGGGQETLGEGAFDKLLAPNAQVAVGYQFNPLFGVRLGVNGWQSKGIMEFKNVEKDWKYTYVAPAVDLTFNLTNAIGGYNPKRVVDLNVFAGIGANVAWDNQEAIDANKAFVGIAAPGFGDVLEYVWDGTKTRLMGHFGAGLDFKVSERVSLGLELQAALLNDHYNSKRADNADWYFNGLVGIKYNFGKTYTKNVIEPLPVIVPEPEVIVQEKIVVVHDTVEVQAPAPDPVTLVELVENGMTRNVFYLINQTVIRPQEMVKVQEIADYMKEHPGTKVMVTGYADRGTGNLAINLRLARGRAQAVADALINKYGISSGRILTSAMTESEDQPFSTPEENRVAICVVVD